MSNINKRLYMKAISFVSILIIVIVIVYLFLPKLYIKMLSDSVEKLERAVVIISDRADGYQPRVIEVRERTTLIKLYNMIKKTQKIEVNRYPRHSVVTSASCFYKIQLFYSSGKIDRFGTPENPQMVYRILENDNNGYIIGQNNELLEYILNLSHLEP